MHKNLLHFIIAGSLASTAFADHHASDWIELFNGENLEGWTQKNGTASYKIENGTIVGRTAVGSPNSFLCTNREFGDFQLEFDVNVQSGLNSGVQIRSQVRDKDVGAKKNDKAGRVNGPQIEIEASGDKGAEAAYVYGEACYGWMVPKEDLIPHKFYKDGEWNHFKVVAEGPRIRTWINGNPVADITHEEAFKSHPKGFLGLQVHGIPQGKGPFQVAWRNIKIKELKSAAPQKKKATPEAKKPATKETPSKEKKTAPAGKGANKKKPGGKGKPPVKNAVVGRPLFNGKNLDGWFVTPEPTTAWRVDPKKGLLMRRAGGSYAWTNDKFTDFVLDLEFNLTANCNSGVFFRTNPEDPVQGGFEIQVFDSANKDEIGKHDCGALYDALAPSENAVKPAGEWNKMRIHVEGPRVIVQLNGKQVINANLDDWKTAGQNPDGSKNKFKTALKDLPRTGHIGLQDHGHNVSFRNITIRKLGGKTAAIDLKSSLRKVLVELLNNDTERIAAAEADILKTFPTLAIPAGVPPDIDKQIDTRKKELMSMLKDSSVPLPTLTRHLLTGYEKGKLSQGEKILLDAFLFFGVSELKESAASK